MVRFSMAWLAACVAALNRHPQPCSSQAAAAAVLAAGSVSGAALANELDIMQEPRPSQQHVIDDAGVMNRTTKKGVNDELTRFEVGL